MSEDIQNSIDQVKARLDEMERWNQDAIAFLQLHRRRIFQVDANLTVMEEQARELRQEFETLLELKRKADNSEEKLFDEIIAGFSEAKKHRAGKKAKMSIQKLRDISNEIMLEHPELWFYPFPPPSAENMKALRKFVKLQKVRHGK